MYILRCVDDSYYTGSTRSIELRLKQHQNGLGARHTAKRLPVELVYLEPFERIDEAFQREKQVQGWSRKKKEALMAGNSNQLHEFSKCKNETHHSNKNVAINRASAPLSPRFQPLSTTCSQPTGRACSLSGAEGKLKKKGISQ